jgi:hypothetical protein
MSRICINNKPEVPTAILAAIDGPYVLNNDNYKIIESVHNAMVGHGGVERTLRKLQDLKLTWKKCDSILKLTSENVLVAERYSV